MPVIDASHSYSLYVYRLQCVELERDPQNWLCAACEISGRGRKGTYGYHDSDRINLLHLERDGLYPKKSPPVFSFFFFFDSSATISPTPRANTANAMYFFKKR